MGIVATAFAQFHFAMLYNCNVARPKQFVIILRNQNKSPKPNPNPNGNLVLNPICNPNYMALSCIKYKCITVPLPFTLLATR